MTMNAPAPPNLPFGQHKNQPLGVIPADYLQWLLATVRLGGGLRAAVAVELARRGVQTPPGPPPRPLRACPEHPDAGVILFWQEDALGRRSIRAECRCCRRFTDRPPVASPYTNMADATASPTPILDALVQLDDLGAELRSDGRSVLMRDEDYRRVPPDLQAVVRQCNHQLARLLGRSRGGD